MQSINVVSIFRMIFGLSSLIVSCILPLRNIARHASPAKGFAHGCGNLLHCRTTWEKIERDTTNFAWPSVYRKHENEWKVECNISAKK
ncbi:MAG TPA: hypothetical protein VH396_00565 [Chitinophagaceae bacterium]